MRRYVVSTLRMVIEESDNGGYIITMYHRGSPIQEKKVVCFPEYLLETVSKGLELEKTLTNRISGLVDSISKAADSIKSRLEKMPDEPGPRVPDLMNDHLVDEVFGEDSVK
jgi:hypothetical protein